MRKGCVLPCAVVSPITYVVGIPICAHLRFKATFLNIVSTLH
jgi:hypothetical protein